MYVIINNLKSKTMCLWPVFLIFKKIASESNYLLPQTAANQ